MMREREKEATAKRKEVRTSAAAKRESGRKGRVCRREEKEEAKKDIHLARGQEGHACLEIGMR